MAKGNSDETYISSRKVSISDFVSNRVLTEVQEISVSSNEEIKPKTPTFVDHKKGDFLKMFEKSQ